MHVKNSLSIDSTVDMLAEAALIKDVATFVKSYMSHFDASHDWHHILRVVGLAKEIGQEELDRGHTHNMTKVILAALLHDVGDRKYLKEGQDGKTLVRDVLLGMRAEDSLACCIQDICTNVSYSSEIKNPEHVKQVIIKYPELAIVQDADRIDAIGSIGIGRCFTYGGALFAEARSACPGQDDTANGRSMNQTMIHFDEKLVKLEAMMKTETGKQMAKERTERLKQFMSWWSDEVAIEQVGERIVS